MGYEISQQAAKYLREHVKETQELAARLCAIPAPSHQEKQRALFIQEWLLSLGTPTVILDEANNVLCPIGCEGKDQIALFTAHTDTVFPDLEPMPVTIRDGRLYCPGSGDDTANVAVLMMLIKYVVEAGLTTSCGVLFALNSCEEGLGNLKGIRQIMKDWQGRIGLMVSLDGYWTWIVNEAVGSKRYKVTVTTEGGHSYGDFGNRNAIQYLASLIQTLCAVKVPPEGKTTFNVGTIQGGTSVNTIAQEAHMLYEYRSDKREGLAFMDRFFESVIQTYQAMGIGVEVELVGDRPCMGDVDPKAQQALTQKAAEIIRQYAGCEAKTQSASTDCNIPCSMGVPAISFGCCLGAGAHTREEWFQLDSLEIGLQIAGAFLLDYFKE